MAGVAEQPRAAGKMAKGSLEFAFAFWTDAQ